VRHRVRVAHATRRPVTRIDVVCQLDCGGVSDRRDRRWSVGRQHVGTCSEGQSLARAATRGDASCTRR
jgi:hypothetical protein